MTTSSNGKTVRTLSLPRGVTVSLVKYTPKMAEEALSKNEVNRSLRAGSVDKYQSDMENGFWNLPDSAICYDTNGRLINGQHRLTAQARAGLTITWIEVRGLPPEYQQTMDNNATRSAADALHMLGMQDSQLLSAIASICVKLERGNFATSKNQVTSSEVIDIVHRSEMLIHSTLLAREFVGGQTPIFPRVVGAAHWWITQNNDVAEADAFITRMGSLAGESKGSPVLALARRANEIRRQAQKVHWRDYFYMVIKTWNYDVEGAHVSKISTYAKSGGYQILTPLVREIPTVDVDEDMDDDSDSGVDELEEAEEE